jgi:hypothetical protein
MDLQSLLQMFGQGQQGQGMSGLKSLLSSRFSHSGRPFQRAGGSLTNFMNQGLGYQQPFYNAGVGATGDYQNWLKGMSDPSKFINEQMGKYQESPYNKFLQDQSMRSGINAASAGGTIGSTPFAQQMQQNSANIAQGEMNDWLQNVLGVNTQYGGGLEHLMAGGQHSADEMDELISKFGPELAQMLAGQSEGENFDKMSGIGGLVDFLTGGWGG